MKERIRKIIRYYNLSNAEFERRCGLSGSTVQNMVRGLGATKLEGVLRAFPEINRVWLITGEGEMLNKNPEHATINQVNVGGDNNGSIANGGGILYSNGPTKFDEATRELAVQSDVKRILRPEIPAQILHQPNKDLYQFMVDNKEILRYSPNIPQLCEYTCTCVVTTQNMEPKICRGDIVALKLMPTKNVFNGALYMLDTMSLGAVMGYITKSGDEYICRSENRELFPDTTIEKDDVYAVWKIVGDLTKY